MVGLLCCKKWGKKPCKETRLENGGCLKILNDTKLVLNEHERPPLILWDQFGIIQSL